MKTLKVNKIEKNYLSVKEMTQLKGGDTWICSCSCLYADKGGSSTRDNGHANGLLGPGGHSEGGDNEFKCLVERTYLE